MSYGRCVACTEEGVKRPFGKVCIYCGTNQKQFSEQDRQERQEAFEDAAELAGQFKWLSIPVGLMAAVLAGVLSFNAGWGAWSALAAVFIGGWRIRSRSLSFSSIFLRSLSISAESGPC